MLGHHCAIYSETIVVLGHYMWDLGICLGPKEMKGFQRFDGIGTPRCLRQMVVKYKPPNLDTSAIYSI